jgi:tetratricopeptide (TPR) repeat protein
MEIPPTDRIQTANGVADRWVRGINMKLLGRVLLVSSALALQVVLARADSVVRSVGGTSIDFVAPNGFCIMEDDHPRDILFINTVSRLFEGADNKLILLTVACERRKTWRSGVAGSIVNYAAYYLPNNEEYSWHDAERQSLRKELCDDMRKQSDATLSNVPNIVADAAKDLKSKIAATSTKYIGVVDEDEHGCYTALLVGVKGDDGKDLLMFSLVTSTVIRGKILFSAIYHEYEGPDTTRRTLEEAKITSGAFDARNPKTDFDPIADVSEAIRQDPKLKKAYLTRGNLYKAKGDSDRAIADYSEAINIDPKYWSALRNRANALYLMGKYDRAIADYDAVGKLDPKAADGLYGRGMAKLKKGDSAEGSADIAAAKAIESDIAEQFVKFGIQP